MNTNHVISLLSVVVVVCNSIPDGRLRRAPGRNRANGPGPLHAAPNAHYVHNTPGQYPTNRNIANGPRAVPAGGNPRYVYNRPNGNPAIAPALVPSPVNAYPRYVYNTPTNGFNGLVSDPAGRNVRNGYNVDPSVPLYADVDMPMPLMIHGPSPVLGRLPPNALNPHQQYALFQDIELV